MAARAKSNRTHIVLLVATIAFGTGGGVWGFIWWQDRPVRKISALLDVEEYEQAMRLADQFLVVHPHDTRTQLLRARAFSALGRHGEADSVFQQVALQSNGFPDDVAALRAWSVTLLHLKKWPRAASVMETLAQSDPSDPEILYRLSVARTRLRQYEAALESTRQLAAIPGHEDQANVMLGTIHHDRGNRRAALDAWEAVMQRNPEAANLQISAGEFLAMVGGDLLEMGAPERAAKTLERSAAKRPDARTHALLGMAYSQTDRQAAAIEQWTKALKLEDLNPIAREELANAALRDGKSQRAVDLMLPLTREPDLQSNSAYILQRAYTQLKQPEKAKGWRDRANVLREAEKTHSAVSEMIRNSTDPFWSGFLYTYQLAMQGEWAQAEEIAVGLLEQRPGDLKLQRLAAAIRTRGEIPPLNELTDNQL